MSSYSHHVVGKNPDLCFMIEQTGLFPAINVDEKLIFVVLTN